MKKILFLSMLCTASSAFAAIDCATPPSCSNLGFTDASTSCSNYVKCPFDQTKVRCLPEIAKAGDILYSDGTTSYSKLSSKTAVGIVVDPGRRYAISLDEAQKAFGPGKLPTYMELMPNNLRGSINVNADGRLNTYALAPYSSSAEFAAAYYCKTYSKAGFSAGSWWLPSPQEITRMAPYFNKIKNGLSRAGGTAFTFTNTIYEYWASSVGTDATLGCWATPDSPWIRCDTTKQTATLPVRCFVQF